MILFRSETPLARGLAPIHTANAALAASASHSGRVKGAVLRTHLIGEVVFIGLCTCILFGMTHVQ
jgi:hypothetical protein